ncbi:MAG: hypothetical protein H7039_15430 [Bryobacteraceae bacterium]|nr:hypothetical protein [Bryobacteraceae bacterium]
MTIRNVMVASVALAAVMLGAERFDHQVRNKFFAGFAGDQAALAEAMKECEEILAKEPKHAEAMVWYGSGQLTQSGQLMQTDRQKGIALYSEGLKNLDEAVALEPDNVGVRAPRAAVVQAVSRFVPVEMQKSLVERVIADYEHTLKLQESHWDQVGSHPKGELLFGLADAYSRTGETIKAESYFARIQTELPGSVYAKRAAKWMDTRVPLPIAETRCVGCHTTK